MAEAREPISLKDAEDGRLMARIERRMECLRRDGQTKGDLSGWGETLKTKFENVAAERSDLTETQSECLREWLDGNLSGRACALEFFQHDDRLSDQLHTPRLSLDLDGGSVWSLVGLRWRLHDTSWVQKHVFQRPPQAVIYETLLQCAEDALETQPENLTANQINLALRKLALHHLPKPTDFLLSASPSEPLPGDQYLRCQIAMELLRLHVTDSSTRGQPPASVLLDDEAIKQFLATTKEDVVAHKDEFDLDEMERINKALEAYVSDLLFTKKFLEKHARYLDEKGAYLLLGVSLDATESEVKKRFHRLSLKAHPDKGGNSEDFQKLKQAYETILKKQRSSHRKRSKRNEVPVSTDSQQASPVAEESSAEGAEEPSVSMHYPEEFEQSFRDSSDASPVEDPLLHVSDGEPSLSDEDLGSDGSDGSDAEIHPVCHESPSELDDDDDIIQPARVSESSVSSQASDENRYRLDDDWLEKELREIDEMNLESSDDDGGVETSQATRVPDLQPHHQMPPIWHRLRLEDLEETAVSTAQKAAGLAHITIQWSKVVDEVRGLARPRGVEHLSGLIQKGAFNAALDVMQPTQEAAMAVMDIVNSAIEATKESARFTELIAEKQFYAKAEKATKEGRLALSIATLAAEVNSAAVKAMGRLNTLGDVAREDDGVHTSLVDMLCLHFNRVAQATQQCARQALVAVTSASQVCALIRRTHEQVVREQEEEEEEEEEDEEEKMKRQEAARECAKAEQQSQEDQKKKGESGEKDGEAGKAKEGKDSDDEGEEDLSSIDGLMGKLKKLHLVMRLKQLDALRKANNDVLDLQDKVQSQLNDTHLSCVNPTHAPGAHSGVDTDSVEWQSLFSTLADLVNQSCVDIDNECFVRLKQRRSMDTVFWRDLLSTSTKWMTTVLYQKNIAVGASTSSRIFRLAALVDPSSVHALLDEMLLRVQGSRQDCGCTDNEVESAVVGHFGRIRSAVGYIVKP